MKTSARAATAWLALALGTLSAAGASAQIRPVFTKDLDARGRVPYNFSVEFTRSACLIQLRELLYHRPVRRDRACCCSTRPRCRPANG